MIYKENKGNVSQLNEEAGIIYSSGETRNKAKNIPGVEAMFRVYFTFTKQEQAIYTAAEIVQAIRPSKNFGSSSKYADGKYLYVIDVATPDDQRKATLLNKGQVLYNCFILDINIFAKEVLYKQKTALTIDKISRVEPIGTSDVITFKTYELLIGDLDITKNSTAAGTATSIEKAVTNLTPVNLTNQSDQQQSNAEAKGQPTEYTLQTLDDGRTVHWALHLALKGSSLPAYKAWYSAAWNTKSAPGDFNGINGPKTQALIKKLKPYMRNDAVKNDKTGTITRGFKMELLKTLKQKNIPGIGIVVESVQLKTSNVRLINFIKPLIEQIDFDALEKDVPTKSTSVTQKKTPTKKTTKSASVDTNLGIAVRESLKSAGFAVAGPGSDFVTSIPYGGSYYRFFNDGTIKRVDKIRGTWTVQGKVGSWKTDVGLDGNVIHTDTAWITTRYEDVITAKKLKDDMRDAFYPQVTGADPTALKRIFTEVDELISYTVLNIKDWIEGSQIEDGYGGYFDDEEDLAWDELLQPMWNTDWSKRMNKAAALIKSIKSDTLLTDNSYKIIYDGAVKSIENIRACFAGGSKFKKVFLNPGLMPITTYILIYYLNGMRKQAYIQLDF